MSRATRFALVLVAFAGLLAGCAHYTLVEPRPRTVGDLYTVDPQIRWSASTNGKVEMWTVDGSGLESVQFLNGLADGEALIQAAAAANSPKRMTFRKTMTPSELAELLADTLTSAGAQHVAVTSLGPHQFGSASGFRCELAFTSKGGLAKQGLAAGAIINDRLYLVLYTGAKLHYYEAHRADAEKIIQSVRMK